MSFFQHTVRDDDGSDTESGPVSVPHMQIDNGAAAIKRAGLEDCLSAIKRGFDELSAGAEYNSVITIDDLREKRRKEGYQADDGTTQLRGKEGEKNDLYGEEWLNERLIRQNMLEKSRYYQFARTVAANSNLPLREFTSETQIQQATAARLRDAAQRLQKIKTAQIERESAPGSIDSQTKRAAESEEKLRSLDVAWSDLLSAQQCFLDAIGHSEKRVASIMEPLNVATDDTFLQSMFAYITRASIMLNGPYGYTQSHQRIKDLVAQMAAKILATSDPASSRTIASEMPRCAHLALYLSILLYVAGNDALLGILASPSGGILFRAGSEYATQPALYARDIVTLANLLFNGGTDNLLQYDNISFLLFAHANKMRRRAQIEEEQPLLRPQLPKPPTRSSSAKDRQRLVDNSSVVFDLGDEELEAIADGDVQHLYTQNDLRRAQSDLGANNSQADTTPLLEALLQPLFMALLPHLFYTRIDGDRGADFEAFAGGYATVEELVRTVLVAGQLVPLICITLTTALSILDASIKKRTKSSETLRQEVLDGSITLSDERVALFATSVPVVFHVQKASQTAYSNTARNRLLRISSALVCFARFVALRTELGARLDGIDNERERQLREYVLASRNPANRVGSTQNAAFASAEDAAYSIFSHTLLSGSLSGADPAIASFLYEISQRRFYKLVRDNAEVKVVYDKKRALLEADAERDRDVLATLHAAREKRLSDEHNIKQQTLAAVLAEDYIPTAQSALSPLNSGVLFFSDLMMGALSSAHITLRRNVPCVAAAYESANSLIESDDYWEAFAVLVQAEVRLIDARNPTTYRPVVNENRSRTQVRSALDTIRYQAANDRSIRHTNGCTCGPGPYGANGGGDRYTMAVSRVMRGTF